MHLILIFNYHLYFCKNDFIPLQDEGKIEEQRVIFSHEYDLMDIEKYSTKAIDVPNEGCSIKAGWNLWPFAHLITYGVIPVEQRLLWVDTVELVWVTILSIYSNEKSETRMSEVPVETNSASSKGSSEGSRLSELRGLDLRTGFFTFRQIKAATNNFNSENKIGEGGFGSVYKGTLLDDTVIAVKQFFSKSKQGNREFVNEVGIISGLHHPNLVKLYGCCVEGNQLLLVYEYMENNSLGRALFGPEEWQLDMDWSTRQKICIGIAKGLAFLHEESTLKVVHKDIKANNVLLDKDLNPKISDFGLAKLEEDDNTHIITRVAGTVFM